MDYEPLFEMGVAQAGLPFCYVPLPSQREEFLVAKPHGSMNMIVEKETFWFSEPNITGSAIVSGENRQIFRGLIPPRFNKSYDQHPIAKSIFDAIRDFTPESVAFWGVGFTSSDVDLLSIYRHWCQQASSVFLIHPHPKSEIRTPTELLKRSVHHLKRPEDL
ncbi:MAG: hypothetical protein ACLPPF_13845 [Rhodomicrobium sp.]